MLIPFIFFSEGKITTNFYDMETDSTSAINLTLELVLMSLIGSEDIPTQLKDGCLEFDHSDSGLPRLNTCAPAIVFHDVAALQDYNAFEEALTTTLIGARGCFGLV